MDGKAQEMQELTTEIVSAYVANNKVAPSELPGLIRTIFECLTNTHTDGAPLAEPTKPNVELTKGQIRRSISETGLISFEDGKTYQTLKRHLTTKGMTFAAYKAKWGLPSDYPSTSPAYAAKRSELAKAAGLGRKPLAQVVQKGKNGRTKKAGATPSEKPAPAIADIVHVSTTASE